MKKKLQIYGFVLVAIAIALAAPYGLARVISATTETSKQDLAKRQENIEPERREYVRKVSIFYVSRDSSSGEQALNEWLSTTTASHDSAKVVPCGDGKTIAFIYEYTDKR